MLVTSQATRARNMRLAAMLALTFVTHAVISAATPVSSHAIVYCNAGTPPYSQCPTVGIRDFNSANRNQAVYNGNPKIDVCEKVRNWADSITVSRRCARGLADSYYDVHTWVQCQGGSPNNIRFIAGNDSPVTHTIVGDAYWSYAICT